MLDTQSAKVAVDLTQEITRRGQELTALTDTPLAMLSRTSPLELTDRAEQSLSDACEEMINLTKGEEHAGVLGNVVKMAADSVRRTLDVARNQAMPHIRRVVALYEEKMAEAGTDSSPYTVVPTYLHESLNTDVAERLVGGLENSTPQSVEGNPFFGKYSPEEIRELVRVSNDGEFNELIDELLMADNGAVMAEVQSALEGMTNVKRVSANAAMPLMLVLKGIDTPKSDVPGPLSQYNANRAVFAANVGKTAAEAIARSRTNIRSSLLYPMQGGKDSSTISVNGEVYSSLLAKGLTVEAVIGNELLGRKYRGEAMTAPEAITDMLAAYARDKATRQQAAELRRAQTSRKAILAALSSDHVYINDEAGGTPVPGDDRERSMHRLRGQVDTFLTGHLQYLKPDIIIASVICNVWYGHTDAGRVISAMMQVEASNPELDAREVATLATMRYIAEWVGSQIGVAKHG